jgi:hypothetical protein
MSRGIQLTKTNSSISSGINNSYSLNFLKEGEYELIFVGYSEEEQNGSISFDALLEAETTLGIDLGAISIDSSLQLTANVTITGSKE